MSQAGRSNRAVIFANGEVTDLPALSRMLHPGDFLIAADGGSRWLTALGLIPQVLVGDMDSLPPEGRTFMDQPGVEVELHPVHKDETDLELALDYAIQAGFNSIRIAGALGGRLDHALGNLMLLTAPQVSNLDIRLDDGRVEAVAVRKEAVFTGQAGDVLSILPLEICLGVSNVGLAYPLNGESLYPYKSRGISNVFTCAEARLSLESGLLIAIHTRLP